MTKRGSSIAALVLACSVGTAAAKARYVEPSQRRDRYSLSRAETLATTAKPTRLPLVVFGETAGQAGSYVPSGYMGDAQLLVIKNAKESAPLADGKDGRLSLRVQYAIREGWRSAATGRNGWAGVFWLAPANNWGKVKGAGFNLSAAKRLTFWMRGEKGGESIAEVKIGGITGPYGDTDVARIGPIRLSDQWEQYSLDLTDKDLRHIVGGFCFVLRRTDNPGGATFYLDEIVFDAAPVAPAVATATAAAAVPTPEPAVEPAVVVASPTVPALTEPVRSVIPFASAKQVLGPEFQSELARLAEIAVAHPEARVRVEGHTDGTGGADLNRRLSVERAKAVADRLVQLGVSRERVSVEGFGEDRPVATNDTPEGRNRNRRVEIEVAPR